MPNQPLDDNDPLKGKKTGGWTKHGGARTGLARAKTETWSCQGCGAEKPEALPGFMFEFSTNEFVKLCSTCHNVVRTRRIDTYYTLIRIVRVKEWHL